MITAFIIVGAIIDRPQNLIKKLRLHKEALCGATTSPPQSEFLYLCRLFGVIRLYGKYAGDHWSPLRKGRKYFFVARTTKLYGKQLLCLLPKHLKTLLDFSQNLNLCTSRLKYSKARNIEGWFWTYIIKYIILWAINKGRAAENSAARRALYRSNLLFVAPGDFACACRTSA